MEIIKPQWPVSVHVNACTTTRLGGESHSPYHSFNLATHVGEENGIVQRNRKKLRREINLPSEPIWLNQVHGNTVVQADQHVGNILPNADAAWTDQPNIVCAVLTADCLPVLLCDKKGTKVAAIHAGWKGLLAGVIENTVQKMNPCDDIFAWLGPAIGPSVFEVSDDVRDYFLQSSDRASEAFKPNAHNKWLANIYQLATQRLNDCGVDQIYGGNYCTYTESDWFYSYRRDHGMTGRMATLIWLSI